MIVYLLLAYVLCIQCDILNGNDNDDDDYGNDDVVHFPHTHTHTYRELEHV